MSRYFVPITINELRQKIANCCDALDELDEVDVQGLTPEQVLAIRVEYGINNPGHKANKDLQKVIFDLENYSIDPEDEWIINLQAAEVTGFHTLSNGLTFCGVCAGGDWEHPVFHILYWDGKNIRGYIPSEGNTYNKEWKTAYGSEEERENYEDPDPDSDTDLDQLPLANASLITMDIIERILPKP